jgi:uncharacterized protein (DUF1015 family)
MVKGNDYFYCIQHFTFMEIFPFKGYIPDLSKISFDDAFYQHMREDFNEVLNRSVFKPADNLPCYYILEIQDRHHTSTGLIALTSMDDYLEHAILRHEHTIAVKEKLHRTLHAARKAMIKPAALLIRKNTAIQQILSACKLASHPILVIKFPDHHTMQRLWKIDSPVLIMKITKIFLNKVHSAIIADGHHRFASLAHVHSAQHPKSILSIYFEPQEMQVSTFYRIIKKLKSESYQVVLDRMKKKSIGWKEVDRIQSRPGIIHLLVQDKIYRFKLKIKNKAPIHLNFSNYILGPVFNINDESKSKRIKYVEYPADEEEQRLILQQHSNAFIMVLPSLTTQQILVNKKILPPKSTLFTPRIINGLIIAPV